MFTRPPLAPALRAVLDGTLALAASLALGAAVALRGRPSPLATLLIVSAGLTLVGYACGQVLSRRPLVSGPADRVTLARAVLAGGCASMLPLMLAGALPSRHWWLLLCAVPALALDGLDGAVARRTRTATGAGALLDMRTDAAFLVVLSALAALTVGWWVLAIGAMRYLFVAASWFRPALRTGRFPVRPGRRVIAALQGLSLCVALTPAVPVPVSQVVCAAALSLLTWSFAVDIWALERAQLAGDGR